MQRYSLEQFCRTREETDRQQPAALFTLAIQLQIYLPCPARHRLNLHVAVKHSRQDANVNIGADLYPWRAGGLNVADSQAMGRHVRCQQRLAEGLAP